MALYVAVFLLLLRLSKCEDTGSEVASAVLGAIFPDFVTTDKEKSVDKRQYSSLTDLFLPLRPSSRDRFLPYDRYQQTNRYDDRLSPSYPRQTRLEDLLAQAQSSRLPAYPQTSRIEDLLEQYSRNSRVPSDYRQEISRPRVSAIPSYDLYDAASRYIAPPASRYDASPASRYDASPSRFDASPGNLRPSYRTTSRETDYFGLDPYQGTRSLPRLNYPYAVPRFGKITSPNFQSELMNEFPFGSMPSGLQGRTDLPPSYVYPFAKPGTLIAPDKMGRDVFGLSNDRIDASDRVLDTILRDRTQDSLLDKYLDAKLDARLLERLLPYLEQEYRRMRYRNPFWKREANGSEVLEQPAFKQELSDDEILKQILEGEENPEFTPPDDKVSLKTASTKIDENDIKILENEFRKAVEKLSEEQKVENDVLNIGSIIPDKPSKECSKCMALDFTKFTGSWTQVIFGGALEYVFFCYFVSDFDDLNLSTI